jgi:Tetratricopeptide repeat
MQWNIWINSALKTSWWALPFWELSVTVMLKWDNWTKLQELCWKQRIKQTARHWVLSIWSKLVNCSKSWARIVKLLKHTLWWKKNTSILTSQWTLISTSNVHPSN